MHCATAAVPTAGRLAAPGCFGTRYEGTTKRPANHSAATELASNARASW
jgi:hypothetical protein